jgi:hypothetical protein
MINRQSRQENRSSSNHSLTRVPSSLFVAKCIAAVSFIGSGSGSRYITVDIAQQIKLSQPTPWQPLQKANETVSSDHHAYKTMMLCHVLLLACDEVEVMVLSSVWYFM